MNISHQLESADDQRASARTSLFLAATLHSPAFCVPVTIRNMSTTGALIEGAAAPEQGSRVRLVRGGLMVPAVVLWSAEGRCGLRLSSLVAVREWLAPPANREQQRVDDIVRLVKAGAIPLAQVQQDHPASTVDSEWLARLGKNLCDASNLLEMLGNDLSGDERVLAAHGDKLQYLDIALQTLTAVSNMLCGADGAAATARLEKVRASCQAIQSDRAGYCEASRE